MATIIYGIVVLILGVILYAVSRMLPPGASTAAYWIGIILAIVGIIIIVLAILGISVGGLFILPFLFL